MIKFSDSYNGIKRSLRFIITITDLMEIISEHFTHIIKLKKEEEKEKGKKHGEIIFEIDVVLAKETDNIKKVSVLYENILDMQSKEKIDKFVVLGTKLIEKYKTYFMNKNLVKPIMQEQEINNDKNITEIKSAGESEINNIKNNLLNEVNKKSLNPKIYFITQEQKNNNDITKDIESKDNSKIKKDITPHDLLRFIGQKVSNEQNNNNNIINYKRNNSNNSITTNIMKNNNENLSLLQSNILGLNTSQQLNDYGQLKYNGNLGFNDINAASQFSFFSSKNQGNFGYNNIFGGQAEENLKQLIGQSSNNFFNSYYSLNGITSSKNFYPHLNNNNYGNGDVQQNINNNNNINCLQINQLGNPISININTANNQPNNEGFFLNNSSNNKNINITNNINNNIKESK